MSTKKTVRIAILSAIAFLLFLIEFNVPTFPEFLKLDFSDVPALIGVYTMGLSAGIWIELIKNILHFTIRSATGGIGELSNFVIGVCFLIPFRFVYKGKVSIWTIIFISLASTLFMTALAALYNYFVAIPLYIKGMPKEEAIKFIRFAIVPFNLLKGIVISVIGYITYMFLKPALGRLVD